MSEVEKYVDSYGDVVCDAGVEIWKKCQEFEDPEEAYSYLKHDIDNGKEFTIVIKKETAIRLFLDIVVKSNKSSNLNYCFPIYGSKLCILSVQKLAKKED